jgi:AcrR family transcriptional regulator
MPKRNTATEKSKRTQILNADEKIMALRGLNDSNIDEIAKKPGVVDSVITQLFKGKEDLLFPIPTERMKDVIAYLSEHLEGIRDPESQLRKMIWLDPFSIYTLSIRLKGSPYSYKKL